MYLRIFYQFYRGKKKPVWENEHICRFPFDQKRFAAALSVRVRGDNVRLQCHVAWFELKLLEASSAELKWTGVKEVLVVGLTEPFQLFACVRLSFTTKRLQDMRDLGLVIELCHILKSNSGKNMSHHFIYYIYLFFKKKRKIEKLKMKLKYPILDMHILYADESTKMLQ